MTTFLVLWVVGIFVATAVGSMKGRTPTGFVLGLLLGFVGAIAALFLKDADELRIHRR
jgi:uncharacterized membrane protein YeaQ/YmgE (transglycosylase-associated protein family)